MPHAAHRSFSYEEFIAAQDKFQTRQADHLAVLNEEVARAIEDVIVLVQVRRQYSRSWSPVTWACLHESCPLFSTSACQSVSSMLQTAPRENPDCAIEPRELELFRSYYSSLMYKV